MMAEAQIYRFKARFARFFFFSGSFGRVLPNDPL
jgi:hypothetical protein